MATRRNEAREKLRRELKAIVARNAAAFRGEHAEALDALLGLSAGEIAAITPEVEDRAVYASLIEVVRDASRKNLSQAALAARIRALGKSAVELARKVGPLARVLG